MNEQDLDDFIKYNWHTCMAPSAPWLGDYFGSGRGMAKWYLNKVVTQHKVVRIKYKRHVWYVRPEVAERFLQYKPVGVSVEYR
ncbi:MAG: hypothetical protein M0R80_09775 [Proteobacteria bacterium]|jgi:predicted deacetylase|nr:hypothetical protein [Pseudomonadota bacterium]